MLNVGSSPWWSNGGARVCFFRPVSALTHWFDYLLWPDTLSLMYAQSLVWFAIPVAITDRIPYS